MGREYKDQIVFRSEGDGASRPPFPARPEPGSPADPPQIAGSTSVATREESVHSRTPVLLRFSVRLPSVEARGRWRERRGMPRR
jgi:hypothetical protein